MVAVTSPEMDTPDRNQTATSSLSKFEDSPVFKYISNLSPIGPVKSVHPEFNSLTFTSPSSLFTSPSISSHRESRFSIRRHPSSDSSRSGLLQKGKENTSEEVSQAVQLSDLCDEQLRCLTRGSLAGESGTEPTNEQFHLAIELPKALDYDSDNSHVQKVPCNEIPRGRITSTLRSVVRSDSNLRKLHHPHEIEAQLRRLYENRKTEKPEGCNWEAFISDVADDLLSYDSSIIQSDTECQHQNLADPGTSSFISTIPQFPQDSNQHLQNINSVGSPSSNEQTEVGESVVKSGRIANMNEIHQAPAMLSGNSLDKLAVSDPNSVDGKGEICTQTGSKEYLSMRRRCLLFEMAAASGKKPVCESKGSSSTSLSSSSEVPLTEKQLDLSNRSNSQSSISSGIGLHLNALAMTPTDGKVVKSQTLASGVKIISIPGCIHSSASSRTSSSGERDLVISDSEGTENASHPHIDAVDEELENDNSKRKRHQILVGESETCKRCNCRRSKCLKLYCECFAAGLYCIEPCSCQDCFNKPIHEDTVLETRRQIESRNPLAFAPKVIRNADASEIGDENKTPASARHKRGCNCKKSNCLKKYCECFQGGAGCSLSCRCEGCRNTFGQKDGSDQAEVNEEYSEEFERNTYELDSHDSLVKKIEEYPDSVRSSQIVSGKLPVHPGREAGPPSQLRTRSRFGTTDLFHRQPKFESNLQAIPENGTSDGNIHASSTASNHTSPKSKRVSVSPPHHHEMRTSISRNGSRKLILRCAPLFSSRLQP